MSEDHNHPNTTPGPGTAERLIDKLRKMSPREIGDFLLTHWAAESIEGEDVDRLACYKATLEGMKRSIEWEELDKRGETEDFEVRLRLLFGKEKEDA